MLPNGTIIRGNDKIDAWPGNADFRAAVKSTGKKQHPLRDRH